MNTEATEFLTDAMTTLLGGKPITVTDSAECCSWRPVIHRTTLIKASPLSSGASKAPVEQFYITTSDGVLMGFKLFSFDSVSRVITMFSPVGRGGKGLWRVISCDVPPCELAAYYLEKWRKFEEKGRDFKF